MAGGRSQVQADGGSSLFGLINNVSKFRWTTRNASTAVEEFKAASLGNHLRANGWTSTEFADKALHEVEIVFVMATWERANIKAWDNTAKSERNREFFFNTRERR
ncbi:uncharacterized protein LAESUDRAFT_761100 [Laetiporus sulphureus 93-53]|uniref:Uncharacterized protein n=1 Tax=Laetiporus sulphureus 93-53 TaxID=1314785 RepID=A0A165DC92_9APHY|nr:uncharacterized protein LAESUDRAFT_761100 [Laetiporus sulphureus 93-53]KZT04542.1 hypothetical protein LAESUDRAFT_761100 [Laetiporus sulphureus 93-53]